MNYQKLKISTIRLQTLTPLRLILFSSLLMIIIQPANAIKTPDDARAYGLDSLSTVQVPEPGNLDQFVKDKRAAIQLGKALFWDMQVGSDGQACASCHFHAGADSRVKNQINPGLTRVLDPSGAGDPDSVFGNDSGRTASGAVAGANQSLAPEDFPFHQLSDPLDRNSAITFHTNDTSSSQGTFGGGFISLQNRAKEKNDACSEVDGAIFHSGGVAVRRVEPRNTPTTINAVFNHRNFWDGRANNIFNGLNSLGRRGNQPTATDANPGVLVANLDGTVSTVAIEMDNASLASQAVGPPLSDFEMSCGGRTFADLGKKMLKRFALKGQKVHLDDSVLSELRDTSDGLNLKYSAMVRLAFQDVYWNKKAAEQLFTADGEPLAEDTLVDSPGSYTQMEVNFAFFWGIAIQLYESSLISDQSPFDQWMEANATTFVSVPGFGNLERLGLEVFVNQGQCIACHSGPELTSATLRAEVNPGQAVLPDGLAIERMGMRDVLNAADPENPTATEHAAAAALYDLGFYNTGVTATVDDIGLGAELAGFPLSFSRQVANNNIIDSINFDSTLFEVPGAIVISERVGVDGAFKVPTIRNTELTGPFFHNGGYATLTSVVEFYNRGGNFRDVPCTAKGHVDGVGDTSGFADICTNIPPDMESLGLTYTQKAALVAFIKSTTDPRVRSNAAPFDHPELIIPGGHPGDQLSTTDDGTGKAVDNLIVLPAIGRNGSSAIGSFLGLADVPIKPPLSLELEALKALVEQEGPVPGTITEELPVDLDPAVANEFAFEGGTTSTSADTEENINLTNFDNTKTGKIDVPTGASPSPLFGAQPFVQQMLRFEEFGPQPLPAEADMVAGSPLPAPADGFTGPNNVALDNFLGQQIYPFPSRLSNTTDLNPWKSAIEVHLGRPLDTPPAEGRPPGEDWAHQRWNEFFPEVTFQTAQAGARSNLGLRDNLQTHGYSAGEFGPGGLYHNTVGVPGFEGTTSGIGVKFHPNFPIQDPTSLWTFDGTFPPKLLQARYGEAILMRHYNALMIDPGANNGFGLHTISTHEHNGHNPAESDGYTQAFFFPGQYYDYRWPMVIAGHDSINTTSTDPRAGAPDGNGGITKLQGDYREIMSTHWFHDHMLDFTAQNVYKGNAAMMNYYSSVDRGNEAINDGVNLRFPSGTSLDWANRDYDINLVIADKAWDTEGQLFFNIFNLDGFVGDQILTNFLWKPYFDVRARRYRFRILNGSVSRYFRFSLVQEVMGDAGELAGPSGSNVSYNRVPFHMIANDGNIMEHAINFDGTGQLSVNDFTNANGDLVPRKGTLPTQSIAERYDIIVDFAQFQPGAKLYLVNILEHEDGARPNREIALQDVLDGSYAPVIEGGQYVTDPGVTKVMEFRVQEYTGTDLSMNPAEYVVTLADGTPGKKMLPLPEFTQAELDGAIRRSFDFGDNNSTDEVPWTIRTNGGTGLGMDPRRLSASVTESNVEIWNLSGGASNWSHPIHIHFEEGQILSKDGKAPPPWEQLSRKDVYRVGRMEDSADNMEVALRFREFLGSFMEHCHNTQHEDHAMLLRWDSEAPGQVRVMPTPMPTWDGVTYVPTFALPTFRSGE